MGLCRLLGDSPIDRHSSHAPRFSVSVNSLISLPCVPNSWYELRNDFSAKERASPMIPHRSGHAFLTYCALPGRWVTVHSGDMYGRPPLGKSFLVIWQADQVRSCIRPLCAPYMGANPPPLCRCYLALISVVAFQSSPGGASIRARQRSIMKREAPSPSRTAISF
jgi:hypothetical protein